MPRKRPPRPVHAFIFKITLLGSDPPIWRRLHVLDTMKMSDFHYAIQIAMGWENCHLHEFIVGKRNIGPSHPGMDEDESGREDEHELKIQDVFTRRKQKARYIYDFGDGWEHELLVEDFVAPDPKEKYPICTGGERACPPEDCGGIWGYYNMLEALKDSNHPSHKMYSDWINSSFDPDTFSVDAVNKEFTGIQR